MKPSTPSLLTRVGSVRQPRNGGYSRTQRLLLMLLCYVMTYPALNVNSVSAAPVKPTLADINIRYEARSGKMSIKATDAPLSELVAKLESAYQILLFVQDVSLDTKITCDVQDQFIDDALRAALPPSSHFFYRFKKGDTELEDRRAATKQTGARTASAIVKTRLQAQSAATSIQPMATAVTAKRIARTATVATPVVAMNMPATITPTAIRAQQLAQPIAQQTDDYFVKMVVKVTPNGYEPVSFTRVKGRLVEDSTAGGDFVYQLKDNGRSVYTGSFQDPLALHSYSPDGNHKVLEAKEAFINITLPKQVLDRNLVKTPSLEFSKMRGEDLPESRNIKLIQASTLQRKGVISADALQKIMPRQ